MTTFDSVLNSTIPWVIAIIGIYILYRPLKEPLAPLFRGIANFFIAIKNKITGDDKINSELNEVKGLEYE